MLEKKIALVMIGSALLMGACEDSQEKESGQSNVSNGVLESDIFYLEFIDAEIIQSSMETSHGVLLTINLTNTSDENIVPHDMLYNYVAVSQTTESSVEYSNTPYHTLDAFGEDADSYNEMVEESRQLHNELLADATVEVRFAYDLNDTDLPVNIIVYNSETNEEEGSYEINVE